MVLSPNSHRSHIFLIRDYQTFILAACCGTNDNDYFVPSSFNLELINVFYVF